MLLRKQKPSELDAGGRGVELPEEAGEEPDFGFQQWKVDERFSAKECSCFAFSPRLALNVGRSDGGF
jgi:hypothetical protein